MVNLFLHLFSILEWVTLSSALFTIETNTGLHPAGCANARRGHPLRGGSEKQRGAAVHPGGTTGKVDARTVDQVQENLETD